MHQDMQIKVIYLSRQIVQLNLSLATKVIKLQFISIIFYTERIKGIPKETCRREEKKNGFISYNKRQLH